MFSYFFCDGMKLIQDVIRLPLALLYVAVIIGPWLVLLSEKPSSTCRGVGQQIAKTSVKLFNFYSFIIFSVSFCDESSDGEESSKTEGNGGTASDPELLCQVIQNTTQRSMSQTAWKWAVLLDILIRCYTNQMQKSSALQCVTRR